MKIRVKPLIISLLIPLAVGGLSALLTRNSMEAFGALNQPPLSPPGWLFPVVWTVLYLLMGFASYLVFVNGRNRRKVQNALFVYGVQLFFNFLWSIIFFNQERYFFAFFWLLALWVLILITLVLFYRIHKPAGLLFIPYLVWVTFAGYLNLGIALLN